MDFVFIYIERNAIKIWIALRAYILHFFFTFLTKSELCPSTFPRAWVIFSKTLVGPLSLDEIFQKPGWKFLPPPSCPSPPPPPYWSDSPFYLLGYKKYDFLKILHVLKCPLRQPCVFLMCFLHLQTHKKYIHTTTGKPKCATCYTEQNTPTLNDEPRIIVYH